MTKQETKLAIEEMGNKVEEARAKMVEDHTAGTRAKQAKEVKTTKKMTGKTPKRPPRGRKAQASSDEENDEDEDSFHSDQEEVKSHFFFTWHKGVVRDWSIKNRTGSKFDQ